MIEPAYPFIYLPSDAFSNVKQVVQNIENITVANDAIYFDNRNCSEVNVSRTSDFNMSFGFT